MWQMVLPWNLFMLTWKLTYLVHFRCRPDWEDWYLKIQSTKNCGTKPWSYCLTDEMWVLLTIFPHHSVCCHRFTFIKSEPVCRYTLIRFSFIILQSFLKKVEELFLCIVCSGRLKIPITLQCSHSFCSQCLFKLLSSHLYRCPLCRQYAVSERCLNVNKTLSDILERLF